MRYPRVLSIAGPKRPFFAAGALLTLSLMAGCGSTYRTVVTPVTTTGPAAQIESYAFVITAPCTAASQNGTACSAADTTANGGDITIVNYSGDTIVDQAIVGPNPVGFALDGSATYGHTLNSNGTISSFAPSTSLQTKDMSLSTLRNQSSLGNFMAFGSSAFYQIDPSSNIIDVMPGVPPAVQQSINLNSVGAGNLVNLVGLNGIQRFYAINQGSVGANDCNNPSAVSVNGYTVAIDSSTNTTIGGAIPVGVCPVVGAMTADGKRTFILNRGSGTVTVVDSQKNVFDRTITVGKGPVYAEILPASNLLFTVNYDDDTVSVIKIDLDVYSNDSTDFGKVIATIPVGHHPSTLTILADGSRAYVANMGTGTKQSDGSIKGTVSEINLTSYTKTKDFTVFGSPRTVVSAQDSLYGKVYVLSQDSNYMSIIRTDQDIVTTSIKLPGYGVDVRMKRVSSNTTNPVLNSRLPGAGIP